MKMRRVSRSPLIAPHAAPWATTSRTEGLTGKQAHPPAPVVVVSAIRCRAKPRPDRVSAPADAEHSHLTLTLADGRSSVASNLEAWPSRSRTPSSEDLREGLAETPRTVAAASGPIEYAERGLGEPVLAVHGTLGGWDQGLVAARVSAWEPVPDHRPEPARPPGNAAVDGSDLRTAGRCPGGAARCPRDRPHHRVRRLGWRTRGLRARSQAPRPCDEAGPSR